MKIRIPRRKWTKEEIDFIKKNYKTITSVEIGKKLKRAPATIREKAKKLGVGLTKKEVLERIKKATERGKENRRQNKKKKERKFKGYSIYSISYFAMLERSVKKNQRKYPLDSLLADICSVFKEGIPDVKGESRKKELVFCRQIFCYLAKKNNPKRTFESIGQFLGQFDHTTVIYSYNKVKSFIKNKDLEFTKKWLYYLKESQIYSK